MRKISAILAKIVYKRAKYFLCLDGGGIGVLHGLISPNPDEHECPVFDLVDGPPELCFQFGALHGTGVAGVAAANSDFLPSCGNGQVTECIRFSMGRNTTEKNVEQEAFVVADSVKRPCMTL